MGKDTGINHHVASRSWWDNTLITECGQKLYGKDGTFNRWFTPINCTACIAAHRQKNTK